MCRAIHASGRRCPNCGNKNGRSRGDRARYAREQGPRPVPGAPNAAEAAVVEDDLSSLVEGETILLPSGDTIEVTAFNADLVEDLTTEDIRSTSEAMLDAIETEKARLRLAIDPDTIPLLDPSTPADLADVQALAAAIDAAYTKRPISLTGIGGTEAATVDLTDSLAAVYGSPTAAVTALGAQVAMRAEEHAGVTTQEVQEAWRQRLARPDPDELAALASVTPRVTDENFRNATAFAAMVKAINKGIDPQSREHLADLAQGYQAALNEVRPMGGDLALHKASSKPAAGAVATAAACFYPADWVAASNEHPMALHVGTGLDRAGFDSATQLKVKTESQIQDYVTVHRVPKDGLTTAKVGRGRNARYEQVFMTYELADNEALRAQGLDVPDEDVYHRREWDYVQRSTKPPSDFDWKRHEVDGRTYWLTPRTKKQDTATGEMVSQIRLSKIDYPLPDQDARMDSAVHELGHRMQQVVPHVGEMETQWRASRAVKDGKPEAQAVIYAGTKETGYRDDFVDHYMGKVYSGRHRSHGGHQHTEVMTTAVQGIFTGGYGGLIGVGQKGKSDVEMRDFALGVLASAGRRDT